MTNVSASAGAQQALVAYTPSQSLIPQLAPPLAAGNDGSASTPTDNRPARLAFLTAGTLLALASIAIAALNGWSRGASLPESLVWAAAGIALALVSLFGLSLMLTHHGQARTTAGIAWSLALIFTVVAALGSQHGGRELAGRTDDAATGNRARFEADHKRATDDLALLPATRPATVIDQELVLLLQDTRLKGCTGWLESWRLRNTCVEKVAPLRAEQSIAGDRVRLQTAIATASTGLTTTTVGKPANTDASAVQRYLGAIGIHVGTERLADILNLLTVFAVEFCGAAALALGRRPAVIAGNSMDREVDAAAGSGPDTSPRGGIPATESAPDRPSPLGGLGGTDPLATSAANRRTLVIERLKAGALEGRQVDIADALGVPRTTLRRIVESDDRLRMIVGPQGTRLELV